ncbi:FG-GAP-like repeat-containing protein [Novosphingobium sp.]|uniref:beta strand repeat-containing protein n=1 Tax=Novosphingobium sp. TaxID=1874826 RepID=UPI002635A5D3|nr:FG-GAP-like repeat-containing protein [Novosphingobium sp.]
MANIINGTSAPDGLSGTPQDDIIHGLGGNDAISGGLGADQLFGDDGDDYLSVFLQGGGPVLVDGGSGNDNISVSNGGGPNQSVSIFGGDGADSIVLNGFASGNTIDAGAGNDTVTLGSTFSATVTLGAGSDVLAIASNAAPNTDAFTVVDYAPGIDRLDLGFDRLLSNWDGSNPFLGGYIRLVADAADTLIQVDRDGGANSWVTLLRMKNVAPSSFGAADFDGFPTDGSAAAGKVIDGTSGPDSLTGGNGADLINGGDGNDSLYGRAGADTINGGSGVDNIAGGAGSDVIRGGDGDDFIYDGQGADQLFGDAGKDTITISLLGGGALLADGGDGNDTIYVSNGGNPDNNQQVTLLGGNGDDSISLWGFASGNVIDAGAGNDTVTLGSTLGATVTLGDDSDTIIVAARTGTAMHTITDFKPGTDKLSLPYATLLTGWDGNANPFAGGFIRLFADGADTLLQIDRDGGGNGYTTLLRFQQLAPGALTLADLGGFPADGSAPPGIVLTGTAGNDTLTGTAGADSLSGGAGADFLSGDGGPDTLVGGSGNDIINGGPGDDVLHGDDGDDSLTDGRGADRIFGGAGNDRISMTLLGGGRIIADGGIGDDYIEAYNGGGANQSVTLFGGEGRDSFSLNGFALGNIIDAGTGDDSIVIGSMPDAVITLGSGADSVMLASNVGPVAGGILITDFQPGTDRLNLALAGHLPGWNQLSNPFAGGFVRLVGVDGDTLIQTDYNGGGDDFRTILRLKAVAPGSLPLSDTGGFDPLLSANQVPTGTNAADQFQAPNSATTYLGGTGHDTIAGGTGNDNLFGNDGDDRIDGGAGRDYLSGGAGNDRLAGGSDSDVIDGGAGNDVAAFAYSRVDVTLTRDADAQTWSILASIFDTDTVRNVEQFQFTDGLYSFNFGSASWTGLANFNPANGWTSQNLYPRHVADVNGDGFGDIVGFGQAGMLVASGSASGTFGAPILAVANFGQASGWSSDNLFHRELADVNGDGRADVIGFGQAGTLVSLARADGTFGNPVLGAANFGTAQGWTSQDGFARTLGDVNGDGKADLIGFGQTGTLVALGNGDGTFQTVRLGAANFGVAQGWTSDTAFHRTTGDVNGDGKADLIGFGQAGTLIALGNGDGTFQTVRLGLADFGAAQGWASNDAFPRFVADVNGDGRADIVGFGQAGTLVAYGNGDGTFTAASNDLANFGAAQGWTSDTTFHREIFDINRDGLPDIVGFGQAGVLAALNISDLVI